MHTITTNTFVALFVHKRQIKEDCEAWLGGHVDGEPGLVRAFHLSLATSYTPYVLSPHNVHLEMFPSSDYISISVFFCLQRVWRY
jgi:hypothetical protein